MTETERFLSEALTPVTATCDTTAMAFGEPGLPRDFLWRDQTLEIAAVIRTWRETGKCRHGSPEKYVRKHWFEVTTTCGRTAKIYFERQQRRGQKGKGRWWLFSLAGG